MQKIGSFQLQLYLFSKLRVPEGLREPVICRVNKTHDKSDKSDKITTKEFSCCGANTMDVWTR